MDIENWGKKQQFSIWLVRQVFRVEPKHEMNHKVYLRAVFFVRKKLNTIEVEMGMSFMWRFWSALENETWNGNENHTKYLELSMTDRT